ncbi:glycosyltransferase involved in cell wall biosynthesis [Inhella inkyongensis]|uniref:Glycosyltransferase involved in cell wall biosynthesis n=1 Tax=Inhella inkyongensis TaxID=392593 RepID=A0A840S819_9BURK|nr:glycosyltransferase family 2 protein [Inhella inkyongensis]MBB5205762.1 glycosyltransferase involved in cell wall biosynthesis [Inhella inkyongensis]
MKLTALIPVYNHGAQVGAVVARLRAQGLPVLLVDDGSDAATARVLDDLARQPEVRLQRLPRNQGKGGAMLAGLRAAQAAGFSHALQIDADGQHAVEDARSFAELAQAHPDHLICGNPVYDASVPKGRLYGRYATHIWVWINTLGFELRDSMCGFRVYPLAPTVALIDAEKVGLRMDFDTEIAVRLMWRGLRVINVPTQVRYPEDGLSHFDVWRDNLLITWMHTRLFFGMLWRLPRLLSRRLGRLWSA